MKELTLDTANQYGFNLEFKTNKTLDEKGYNCLMNETFPTKDGFVEIDVIAKDAIHHLLIECKGASKDTILLLTKAATNRIAKDKIGHTRYNVNNGDYRMPIFNIGTDQAIYTNSGDFFHIKKDGSSPESINKASKNDAQNNFYKAQKQLLAAITAYSNANPLDTTNQVHSTYIVPLIVTNAQIWVVDYNENEPKISQQGGTLHRVVNDDNVLYLDIGGDSAKSFVIPVINYSYLESFLRKLNDPPYIRHQIALDLSYK